MITCAYKEFIMLKVSAYAGYLYDAVMVYARTADSMVQQGLDPRDGKAVLQHAQSISFLGELLNIRRLCRYVTLDMR